MTVFAVFAALLMVASAVAGLSSERHIALWLFVASIIYAILCGSCWLHIEWTQNDSKSSKRHQGEDHGGHQNANNENTGNNPRTQIGASEFQAVGNDIDTDSSNTPAAQRSKTEEPKWWSHEWAMIGLTGLILAVYVATGIAIYGQWTVMSGQLEAMNAQSIETAKQSRIASGQLAQAIKATQQTDAVIEQMRLDNRAWLALEAPKTLNFAVGQQMILSFEVRNSGKTPGAIVEESHGLMVFALGIDHPGLGKITRIGNSIDVELDIESLKRQMREPSPVNKIQNVAAPGGMTVLTITLPRVLDQENVENVTSQAHIPLFLVRILYTDVGGAKHETWSCFVYHAVGDFWEKNLRYNYMD